PQSSALASSCNSACTTFHSMGELTTNHGLASARSVISLATSRAWYGSSTPESISWRICFKLCKSWRNEHSGGQETGDASLDNASSHRSATKRTWPVSRVASHLLETMTSIADSNLLTGPR